MSIISRTMTVLASRI